MVIFTLLVSECALKLRGKSEFEKKYAEAKEIAAIHKIDFRGEKIDDCQYRIGKQLISLKKIKDGLEIHLRVGFEEYGGYL